jgi:hypothetical protein
VPTRTTNPVGFSDASRANPPARRASAIIRFASACWLWNKQYVSPGSGTARHRCPLAVKAAHAVLLDVLDAPISGVSSVMRDHPQFTCRRAQCPYA